MGPLDDLRRWLAQQSKYAVMSRDKDALPSGLLSAGNIDLWSRPVVTNPDGSISTVRSVSFNVDGKETLIPTVADNGRGLLSDADALKQFFATGRHLGMFDTPQNADSYARQLHNLQADMYLPKKKVRK